MNHDGPNDLSLRVTALTMATEAARDSKKNYDVTDLAQWMYDWLKDAEAIDNPKKTSTLSVVN